MKTILTLLKNVALSLIMLLSFSENAASQNSVTIDGKIVTRPMPPEQIPTNGELVYAIRVDTICYITTINNSYAGLNYFGQLFVLNDSVEAVGEIHIKYDCNSEAYYEIELESIIKIKSAPSFEIIKGFIEICEAPNISYTSQLYLSWNVRIEDIVIFDCPEKTYILCENSQWYLFSWSSLFIGDQTYNLNDSVTVIGILRENYDSHNKKYYTLDFADGGSITSAKENEKYENAVTISPNPCKDFVEIKSNYYKIKNIDIYDIYGKTVLSKKDINHNNLQINNIKEKGILFVRILLNNKQIISRKILVM